MKYDEGSNLISIEQHLGLGETMRRIVTHLFLAVDLQTSLPAELSIWSFWFIRFRRSNWTSSHTRPIVPVCLGCLQVFFNVRWQTDVRSYSSIVQAVRQASQFLIPRYQKRLFVFPKTCRYNIWEGFRAPSLVSHSSDLQLGRHTLKGISKLDEVPAT